MTRHPALPGYIAIALALLFPAYWIPMLSSGLESFADAYRTDVMQLSAVVMNAALFVYAVLGLVLSIVLLSRGSALPRLLKVFAVLLAVACVLQLTVVGGLLNVVLFPLILSVLAVLFIRGDHEVEVVQQEAGVTTAESLIERTALYDHPLMSIVHGFAGAIGNTPLIRLDGPSRATGCEILGKAEFMNPGGTVVEGTAGHTGIAPAVPYANDNHYQRVAGRLADELPKAIWANLFDNTANRDGRYATTGAKIRRDTAGRIDAFVAASGTGGTLGGVSRDLREKSQAVRIVLADPQGSALYRWVKYGELKAQGPDSITEGIGIGRITAELKDSPIDDVVHRLLREEGLFLGSASGAEEGRLGPDR